MTIKIITYLGLLITGFHIPLFFQNTCTLLGGDWNSEFSWDCGVVPDFDDDVIIEFGEVFLTSDVGVNSITMTGGMIQGTGNTDCFTFDWQAGDLDAFGTMDVGDLSISS